MTKTYNINLNNKKLSDYILSNQVYDGNKIFGDINGKISGYLKHYDTEYIKVEIEGNKPKTFSFPSKIKTYKRTGESEVKGDYRRWVELYSDGSIYWSSWEKQTNRDNSSFSFWEMLGFLLQTIIGAVVIIPLLIFGWKVILPIAILLSMVYLLSLLSNVVIDLFKWILRFVGIIFLFLMVFGITLLVTNTLKYPNNKRANAIDDVNEVTKIEENLGLRQKSIYTIKKMNF